jgi:hypothetical protein
MIRGTNGPIQWLMDLRTYGRTVFTNTPVEGQIEWKSGDELLYKQIHFTMGDFRGFVHGLVGKTRQILVEQLMFCPPGHRARDSMGSFIRRRQPKRPRVEFHPGHTHAVAVPWTGMVDGAGVP